MIKYNAEQNFQSDLAELHWVYIKQNSRYRVNRSLILTVVAGIPGLPRRHMCCVTCSLKSIFTADVFAITYLYEDENIYINKIYIKCTDTMLSDRKQG